jgi:hypothetical protein
MIGQAEYVARMRETGNEYSIWGGETSLETSAWENDKETEDNIKITLEKSLCK